MKKAALVATVAVVIAAGCGSDETRSFDAVTDAADAIEETADAVVKATKK